MDKIIQIPERKNAPKIRLHINIACKNKTQLGIRPIIFILPGGPGADGAAYKSYSCLLDVTDIVYYDPRGCGLKFVKNFGMETLLMPKK